MQNDLDLKDTYGRDISYLRVSLTEQCNLRCDYCYDAVDKPDDQSFLLSNKQILKLIEAFALLGVEKIRFTGGEPLLRKGIAELIKESSAIDGISYRAITTNGILLEYLLPDLIAGGLNRLNVSLDTLQRDKFKQITGYDGLNKVINGIKAASDSDAFSVIKINVVVMKGINDDEIANFVEWSMPYNYDIRFIEYMPTIGSKFGKERFLPENEIKNRVKFELESIDGFNTCRGPAESFLIKGSSSRISFISPVSNCFCQKCNRLRLTSHGDLIGCLFGNKSISLRSLIPQDLSVHEIALYLRSIVKSPDFRRFSKDESISDVKPFMRGIGG